MEGTDCLPMEMAVSLAGNPTLIMLDSSGALHIPADDTVALAAAQGIKIEESDQLSSEPLVLDNDRLDNQSINTLCKSEDVTTSCPESIIIQPQLQGTDLSTQYQNSVQASTEVIDGEHYLRLVNSDDQLSEGMVGVDASLLSQTYFPFILDQEAQDNNAIAVTAQIIESGGRKMIIFAPPSAANNMQQVQMVEAQSQEADLPEAQATSCIEITPAADAQSVNADETEEPDMKKIKLEQEDDGASVYVLTVPEIGEEVAEAQEEVVSVRTPKLVGPKCTIVKNAGTAKAHSELDVTQAWFTTKDDKVALQSKGHQWKQGQWTKEEVDLLERNIIKYCVEHQIEDPTEVIFQFSKEERKDFYRTVAKGLQRPLFSVYRRVIRMYDQKNHIGKYTAEEIAKLKELRQRHGSDWATIGAALGRSASSVKDRCRLMKDTCNTGKWLPEEERLLAQAVYDLSGCEPGDSVTKGLSWAMVADRVGTRSEKQCRTKWLNYLNWKQVGGSEWTREDDILLINKLIVCGAADETQVDWIDLSENWPSARSPQWLRGKWWTLKRHIADYQRFSLPELLEMMKKISFPIKTHIKNPQNNDDITPVTKLVLSNMGLTLPVASGADAVTTTSNSITVDHSDVSSSQNLTLYPSYSSVITSQPQGAFIITQPQTNSAIALAGTSITTDGLIVHTLPFNQEGIIQTPDVLNDPGVAVQLNPQQVIISSDDSQNSITATESIANISVLQLGDGSHSDHDYQPLSQRDQIATHTGTQINQSDLQIQDHITSHGEMMTSGVDLDPEINKSDITAGVTEPQLDDEQVTQSELDGSVTMSAVSTASPQFVPSSSNDFMQNMSSLSDPMFPSENPDLMGSSSDVEGDKSQCGPDAAAE